MSRTGGGKEVLTTAAVAVAAGVGVAALAGLGLAGAFGVGVLGATAAGNSFAQRRAKPPLQPGDVRWDAEGRIQNWGQVIKAVQHGGIAPELRAELWPLLLGVFPRDSTHQERSAELERLRRLYIKLVLVCKELDAQLQALRSSGGADSSRRGGSDAAASAAAAPSACSGGSGSADCSSGAEPAATPAAGEAEPAAAPAAATMSSPAKSQARSASAAAAAGGSSSSSSPSKSPLPLPGNLAAFAEAHRIIVMDAVRTDLRRGAAHPGMGPSTSAALPGGAPTVTILPVAVGDGLPELMMVSTSPHAAGGAEAAEQECGPSSEAELAAVAADPGAAAAAAAGRLPRWRSPLARDMLWGAAHLDDPHRCQMLRLVNLLSAYSVHDPETGYCQGMSDLASVFVQLFDRDDALAFACFERLMRGARRNFKHDETGIRHQLQQIARVLRDTDPSLFNKLQDLGAEDCMFAYRMVVVMMRRELPPTACCTLWEMQWAHAAADADASAGSGGGGGGSSSSSSRAAAEQPPTVQQAPDGGSGSDSGGSSAAAAGAGLRSTVQGLSEATARAAAAAGSGGGGPGSGAPGAPRPGSASSVRLQAGGAAGQQGQQAPPPPEFVLHFIAAVVRAQRARIMIGCREHDDVLRLCNSLQIDFWPAVAQARKQHKAYVSHSQVAPPTYPRQ